MKNLKRLGASVTLMFVLAVAAFAGETNSPPCASPEPGQVGTPPCAASLMTPGDTVASGETNAPPASNAGTEFSVADVAIDLLQSVLSLF
jgi:hypothetical protein